MDKQEIKALHDRNNIIIKLVLEKVQNECPDSVDLIGIAGSFCNGDIYLKSDLDLVIIKSDDGASCLNKCFILEDVGFDIYTSNWAVFEHMAEYHDPYVTKLFDLDIVYSKDVEALKIYRSLQDTLKKNMNDDEYVRKQISNHFSNVLSNYYTLKDTQDRGNFYRLLARIIQELEFTLFMINRSYIKRGVKRIPEEIEKLEILPSSFIGVYKSIFKSNSLEDIKLNVFKLINNTRYLLDKMGIDYKTSDIQQKSKIKKDAKAEDLVGTYEEIYSNWRNKMYHAASINSHYLSFMTMSSCQQFYDDFADSFNIPHIELLEYYDSKDLEKNAQSFDRALEEWKKLYDAFDLPVQQFASIEELKSSYSKESQL